MCCYVRRQTSLTLSRESDKLDILEAIEAPTASTAPFGLRKLGTLERPSFT